MERVSRFVVDKPGLSKHDVVVSVSGNTAHKRLALSLLISEGYVSATPKRGRGGGMGHNSIRPYIAVNEKYGRGNDK
jgi:hypothetical protein